MMRLDTQPIDHMAARLKLNKGRSEEMAKPDTLSVNIWLVTDARSFLTSNRQDYIIF